MIPKRVIIFRHGESYSNIDKTVHEEIGDHDIELTDKGIEQSIKLGSELINYIPDSTTTMWSSSYVRAIQTAEHALINIPHINTIIESPLIREQDWGNFYTQDDVKDQMRDRRNHSYFYYRLLNGESGADVYTRVSLFLIEQFAYNNNNVDCFILSTHGITGLIIMMKLLGWTTDECDNADRFSNCGFVVLDYVDGKYQITVDRRRV